MHSLHRVHAALLAAIALALPGANATAWAQSQAAVVPVSAFVDVLLEGNAIRDLDFGVITPGTSRTVAPTAASGCAGCLSGQWQMPRISNGAQANRQFVQLTYTSLPSALTHVDGVTTMPISWTNGAGSALMKNGTEYYWHTPWTPVQGVSRSVRVNPDPLGTNGTRGLNIYLGGTLAPTSAQKAGAYHGVVTLQMTYGST